MTNFTRVSGIPSYFPLFEASQSPDADVAGIFGKKANTSSPFGDVIISNSESLSGIGNIVSCLANAANIAVLTNYNPRLAGVYVSSALNASNAAFKITKSRYANLRDITSVNTGRAFLIIVPDNTSTDVIALPIVANCDAEGITTVGISIGSSVSEGRFSNIHLYGLLTNGTGGLKATAGSIGWRQNTTVVNNNAVGGHQITNLNVSDFNQGLYLTDAQLTKFSNCIADSCADYGLLMDGACQYIDFDDLFVGSTRGIKVGGTCQDIHFDGLRTIENGLIPPWGSTDFYNNVVTFYDLEVRNTAKVRVSNWQGSKRIAVDSTAKLIVQDGIRYTGRALGTVGAATTAFLCDWGSTGTEADALWRAPYDCYLIRMTAWPVAAPGAGQTFTYTARVNFADSTLQRVVSGTADFGGDDIWAGALIPVSKGQQIGIKLITSATAVVTRHYAEIQIVPR